jgi:hypothetical protein
MRLLAVALAAVLLAACGSAEQSERAASPATTASVASADATTTTGGVAAASASNPTTRTRPAAGAGATAATANSPASSPSQASTPAPRGTYRFDTNGYSQSSGGERRAIPSVTTLRVDPESGTSQRQRRDLRDANGQGQLIETVFDYQPDGVRLESLKITTVLGGGLTDVRDLRADPPAMIARTGAAPGDRYEFTLTGSGTTAHGVISVMRNEQMNVGGQMITAAVVTLHVDFSGSVTGAQDATNWIDRDHLLTVKEQVVTDAHAGAVSTHTEYTALMQRLEAS